MKYGGGELNAFLYLLAPEEVLKATAEWRETLVSDFWDEDAGLSQNLRAQCYVLAYSIDSDLFVFHPNYGPKYDQLIATCDAERTPRILGGFG